MTDPSVNNPAGNARIMIEQVVKSIVDETEQVSVTLVEEPRETVIEIEVAPRDVGKVIGKQGRTIRAMRNLLSAAGARSNKRYALEIIEDEAGPADAGNS